MPDYSLVKVTFLNESDAESALNMPQHMVRFNLIVNRKIVLYFYLKSTNSAPFIIHFFN